MNSKIWIGDAFAGLSAMRASGMVADMCVTSPPYYGLRDYGVSGQIGLEESPAAYIYRLVEVFRWVREVLADDGTLWVNIGDSYAGYHGNKNAGYSDAPSNKSGYFEGQRESTANRHGLKQKDLIGIPWMLAFALRDDGWHLRQDIIWHKPNPMPESVTDRCTRAHEYIFMFSKKPMYYYDADAIKEDAVTPVDSKANSWERAGKHSSLIIPGQGHPQHRKSRPIGGIKMEGVSSRHDGNEWENRGVRNKRSVWDVATKPYKGAHFAVFPPALITPCILAGSRKGGVVLDPFMGSGTVAEVANNTGRLFAGCELNHDNIPLQRDRLGMFASNCDWIVV